MGYLYEAGADQAHTREDRDFIETESGLRGSIATSRALWSNSLFLSGKSSHHLLV